jgi:hypothetical protein
MLLHQPVDKVERDSTAGNHNAVLIIRGHFLSEDLPARCTGRWSSGHIIATDASRRRHTQSTLTADRAQQRTDRFRHPVVAELRLAGNPCRLARMQHSAARRQA